MFRLTLQRSALHYRISSKTRARAVSSYFRSSYFRVGVRVVCSNAKLPEKLANISLETEVMRSAEIVRLVVSVGAFVFQRILYRIFNALIKNAG